MLLMDFFLRESTVRLDVVQLLIALYTALTEAAIAFACFTVARI